MSYFVTQITLQGSETKPYFSVLGTVKTMGLYVDILTIFLVWRIYPLPALHKWYSGSQSI